MKKKIKCPKCGMGIRCWVDIEFELVIDIDDEDTATLYQIQNKSFGNERIEAMCNSCDWVTYHLTMDIEEPEFLNVIEKILEARFKIKATL